MLTLYLLEVNSIRVAVFSTDRQVSLVGETLKHMAFNQEKERRLIT
jgi:hypothetical protein